MASEQKKFTREEVYLAALLHDIGKFWQRADEDGARRSILLSDYIKNILAHEICPVNEKGYSHKHVLWTAQFFETHNNVFKNLIKSKAEIIYGDLMLLSSRHHNPATVFEKIIQKADHYSAGMDRTKENGWKDAAEENDEKWDAFKRIQARPIFSVIGNNINTNLKTPVSPLSLNDEFITYKETEYNYNKLWDEFTSEFKFIQNASFKAFVETLISLLEKYTTRIPASTKELPDVSLFDHLKTTAAFALCLYDYIEDKSNFRLIPSQEEKPFLLLGGDLSGIQKFIYTITPRRAVKNLKGRSFYLQLLINNIVNFYIDELNLFSSNIIYQSGGAFYIITPNNKNTIEKINKISKEIEIRLFNYHSTDIYLATDYIEFGEKELFENIGEIWYQLTEKLGYKKGHRFENIIKEKYSLLFQPDNKSGADARRDYITGEPLTGDGIPLEKDNNETLVNSYTYKQIELGQKLRDADFWIQSKVIIDYWKNDFFDPVGLGYYN